MYSKPFYITGIVGNNVFSFGQRENRKLYVPSLKRISSFDEIELQDDFTKVAFEDFDFDGILSTSYGLKNFYEIVRPHFSNPLKVEGIKQSIFLFDNHNHALFFWYLARSRGIIGDNNILYHIDEHADTREPGEYISKPDSYDLEKVFQYTNFSKINVGNYIIPAQKEGIIGEVIQIRNEMNLLGIKNEIKNKNGIGIILNLDLDFFQSDLDFIDYNLKKKVILNIAKEADLITVATSPFFIKQELALTVFKDLFDNK